MFSLNDLLAVLDHWPIWKKIKAAPEHIEALEKRVAELETRLQRAPGQACPRCGELAIRVASNKPHPDFPNDITIRTMKCEKCGYTETKSSR
jgi:predicted RNA-binding Zn-ribbon protein involved in translation (DUF1610 family)